MPTKRILALVLAAGLVACGGVEDTSDPAGDGNASGSGTADDGEVADVANGAVDPHASVTVGGQRYEVDLAAGNNSCTQPMEGNYLASGYTDDADPSGLRSETRTQGARVHVSLSEQEGDLAPSTQVVVEDYTAGVEWWADPNAGGEVEEWSLDGSTITGIALFVDTEAERLAGLEGQTYEPVAGEFEIVCDFG